MSERGLALRSIEHQDAKVTVYYRYGDVEVMVVEINGRRTLEDPTLCGVSSWHLVLEGEALFHVDGRSWDVLPDQALRIDNAASYTVSSASGHRVRLLSVVVAGDQKAEPEGMA